jgi:hypothetical protein
MLAKTMVVMNLEVKMGGRSSEPGAAHIGYQCPLFDPFTLRDALGIFLEVHETIPSAIFAPQKEGMARSFPGH